MIKSVTQKSLMVKWSMGAHSDEIGIYADCEDVRILISKFVGQPVAVAAAKGEQPVGNEDGNGGEDLKEAGQRVATAETETEADFGSIGGRTDEKEWIEQYGDKMYS